MSRETNIAKSEWRVRGSEVWGMRTRGHKRDRLEDSSIAYASQPPGTYIDDALEIVALIAEAGTVLHETGLTPRALAERIKLLEQACQKQNESICQTLGKALGYPRYCDDQANFPGATEADGVCAGDHVAESLATAAAERIKVLEGENQRLRELAESYDERLQDQARETERIEERLACYDALELTRHEKMERLEGERAEVVKVATRMESRLCGFSQDCPKLWTSFMDEMLDDARDLLAKLEGTQGK